MTILVLSILVAISANLALLFLAYSVAYDEGRRFERSTTRADISQRAYDADVAVRRTNNLRTRAYLKGARDAYEDINDSL